MKGVMLGFLLVSLALTGCVRMVEPKGAAVAEVQTLKSVDQESNVHLTQAELQAELMNYADSFAQLFGGSCTRVERAWQDPDLRLLCKEAKVFSISSVFSIAAGPSPEASLLDMLVVATLNRMLWDNYALPQQFGDKVFDVRDTLAGLEKDIWRISSQVLDPDAQATIHQLIQTWWEQHPHIRGVNFVRFSGFSGLLRGQEATGNASGGGILDQVSKVTQQVDASLLLAERGMYLVSRLQLLASLQVDQAYMNILNEPETSRLLGDINALVEFTQRLPDTIARERSAALEQLVLGISTERNAAILQAMEKIADERKASIEQLMTAFAEERRHTIEQAAASLNTQGSDLVRQLISSQDHAFWLGLKFLVSTLFGTVAAALTYRYLRYRLIDMKSAPKSSGA